MKGNLLLKDLKDVMPEIVFNIFKEKIIDFCFVFFFCLEMILKKNILKSELINNYYVIYLVKLFSPSIYIDLW